MVMRAFDANATRSVRRATIVYSADDIRRNITLRLKDGLPCNLELGADITITSGLTIPGQLASFSLDGGTRYKLNVGGNLASIFSFEGRELAIGSGPSSLLNLAIIVGAGFTVTTAFIVRQTFAAGDLESALTIDQVSIDASAGTMTNVFGMGSTGTRARIVATGMAVFSVLNMFSTGSNLTSYLGCRFTDLTFSNASLVPTTIGLGSLSPALSYCVFLRVSGMITVDTGSFSTETLWMSVTGDGSGTFVTNNPTGGKPQTLVRVSGFTARTLSPDDIDLDVVSGGGGGAPTNATYVTLSTNATLTNERVLTAGAGVTIVDGGAGGTVTISSTGGGATLTAATITVPFELQEQTATIVDASATAASKVMVVWGNTANTDENQPSSSNVTFSAVGAAGQVLITVSSNDRDNVGGTYKVLYLLG